MSKFDLLKVAGLTAGYRPGVAVLHGVDLSVKEHEVVAILGSNGAGKSTLISTIAGSMAPSSGTIAFDGEDVAGFAGHALVARGLVAVLSGRRVFPDLTVEQNLRLGASAHRKDVARIARSVAEMTSKFEVLDRCLDKRAGLLSGGEQQILVIARALMARPKLLLLDEPSMGLDPITVRQIFEIIRDLRDQGTTILMVEKLAHAATSIADRIYVMELGKVVLEGPASELAHDPRIERAYLGG